MARAVTGLTYLRTCSQVLTPPVKSKLIFPGLAPLRVKAPLGTRINELGNRNTTAKNPYDSQSLLEAARQLWDDCDCSDHASR